MAMLILCGMMEHMAALNGFIYNQQNLKQEKTKEPKIGD